MKERTIIINSASKTFSMTGWRIGYAIAPAHIIKYLNKVHQNMSTCATSLFKPVLHTLLDTAKVLRKTWCMNLKKEGYCSRWIVSN